MTDPRRWSEEGEASELTRELLLAGQSRRMPESERRALWAGITLSLPVAAPAPSTSLPAPVAATSALGAYFTKGVIFLAALGGLTVGGLQLWPRAEPVAKATAGVRAAPTATAEPPQADEEASVTSDVTAPALALPSKATQQRVATESQLREESLAVLAARSALRSGDAARSLTLLEQARARFPRGALGQEREALTIDALAKSGQAAAARRRAEAFLRAHPSSPYVADVRRIAQQ